MSKTDKPPKIPKELSDLDRAITLLGSRGKAELRMKSRKELENLVGSYPNLEKAAVWKRYLRSYRKEFLNKEE